MPEGAEQIGTEDGCGLLQKRIHASERRRHDQIGGRRKGQPLHEDHSRHGEDVDKRVAAEHRYENPVDHADPRAGQQHPPDREQDARNGHRQYEADPRRGLEWKIGPLGQPGEHDAEAQADESAAGGEDQGIQNEFIGSRIEIDIDEMSQRETGVEDEPGLLEAAQDQQDQWNDDQIHEDDQNRANDNMDPANPEVR